ncbi:hypothetical protein [Ferrimicrobium acidiphilum]|jgi:hypothetical protein|uniref:Uncharacterized protein n=1 Tax=Ferrimicrobium acidiphilum DSM 19497 TaxID=1121877 RepID=A0A0D8FVE6_9ACTN|nr:hypothetical protein [Ferrimicrobium acidiphilum]KJE76929.1 hypothetical protein FEAC_12530 [Ferrimicrobium acidiphilum DSM 19497]MCL5053989.1 hypothetical protein [Gammaproteobacteria bacterium]
MSELTSEEELALVAATAMAVYAARRTPEVAPIVQDPTTWRFQNRWWATGPLASRARPTLRR